MGIQIYWWCGDYAAVGGSSRATVNLNGEMDATDTAKCSGPQRQTSARQIQWSELTTTSGEWRYAK